MAQTCAAELHELPEETLLSLFRWLAPRDVLACGSTNWRLRRLALDGAYWREACAAYCEDRGLSTTEQQSSACEDLEWWREYFTLTRSQLETQACHPLQATKGHHYDILGFDASRNEVVWTDQRRVCSVSLDRPNEAKACPAALVPSRANKALEVRYSDGAVLSLVEGDQLKVYDLVTGDVLKAIDQVGAVCCSSDHLALWRRPAAVLELYDRRQGWDAPPVWKAPLGNRYTVEPTLFLDSSAFPSEQSDGGGVLVAKINNSWRVFRMQNGTALAEIKHCTTYQLTVPLSRISWMARESDMPHAKAVALMTPDHVLCCHPAYIRVIWKASLQKGAAPKYVDVHWEQQSLIAPQVIRLKLSGGGTGGGDRYLLAAIAGNEVICWELPTEWQEKLELFQGRPLVHPLASELHSLTGLHCDGDRLFLWSVLRSQRGTSARFQLHEHEVAVFSVRRWALCQRMHLGTAPAANVMGLPEGRAVILTRSLMWGRDWVSTVGWSLSLLAPAQAKRNVGPETNKPAGAE